MFYWPDQGLENGKIKSSMVCLSLIHRRCQILRSEGLFGANRQHPYEVVYLSHAWSGNMKVKEHVHREAFNCSICDGEEQILDSRASIV